jgi:hypothetical protein
VDSQCIRAQPAAALCSAGKQQLWAIRQSDTAAGAGCPRPGASTVAGSQHKLEKRHRQAGRRSIAGRWEAEGWPARAAHTPCASSSSGNSRPNACSTTTPRPPCSATLPGICRQQQQQGGSSSRARDRRG